jgi:peroxiredoxin Q/BCP
MATITDVGDRVPSFVLPDQDGVAFDLDAELGKGFIVLFFYPKDETPVCTVEACEFRDAYEDFKAAGAVVVGISSDGPESHRSFARRHNLGYRLLTDRGSKVRDAFGMPRSIVGLAERRVTYVIDGEGIVRHRIVAMLRAKKHVEEALASVRRLAQSAR